MGLLDTILGRSKPVRPDLDQLFAVPSAALTLQAGAGFTPTGLGSVCFAGVEGGTFARIRQDVRELLDADTDRGGIPVEFSQDTYGYTWLLSRRSPDDVAALVNDLHAVNTLLQDGGFGPQLLCSLIGFRDAEGRSLALVYLYKRGTFYPFAPVRGGAEKRDNQLELQIRATLGDDLRVEKDLSRWFPVWGRPDCDPGAEPFRIIRFMTAERPNSVSRLRASDADREAVVDQLRRPRPRAVSTSTSWTPDWARRWSPRPTPSWRPSPPIWGPRRRTRGSRWSSRAASTERCAPGAGRCPGTSMWTAAWAGRNSTSRRPTAGCARSSWR